MFFTVLNFVILVVLILVCLGVLGHLLSQFLGAKLAANITVCAFCAIVAVTTSLIFLEGFFGNFVKFFMLEEYQNPFAYIPALIFAALSVYGTYHTGRNVCRMIAKGVR